MPSRKGDHGLLRQIKYVEESIKEQEADGQDASYSKELVKAWREYLPGGPKHHLWLSHSKLGYRFEDTVHKPLVKA